MKKFAIIAIVLLASVVLVSGCVQSGTKAQNAGTQSAGSEVQAGTRNGGAGTQAATGQLKEFNITAKRFSFEPSTITVNLGDRVKLNIAVPAGDTKHGFNLPEFGARADLEAGRTTAIEFVAGKIGAFDFKCDVVCGEGHSEMAGTLIVK